MDILTESTPHRQGMSSLKMLKVYLQRKFFKLLGKKPTDFPMVKYWKTKDAVEAKVTSINGVTVMIMDGEDYPFPTFPRGYLLFGKLSKLKHEVKNQIFNDSWAKLEKGIDEKIISREISREILPKIYEILKEHRFDMIPPQKMTPSVQEIYRAFTKVAPEHPELRDLITYILQEDDAYRFRLQWIVTYFGWFRFFPVKAFERGLTMLEHGEVIDDMKERQRLFKRIMIAFLKDGNARKKFNAFFKEVDWSKVKLSKADKYFFRGKYFKVDLDKLEY